MHISCDEEEILFYETKNNFSNVEARHFHESFMNKIFPPHTCVFVYMCSIHAWYTMIKLHIIISTYVDALVPDLVIKDRVSMIALKYLLGRRLDHAFLNSKMDFFSG